MPEPPMPASKFFRPEILRAKAYAGFAEEGFIRLDAHENPYPCPSSCVKIGQATGQSCSSPLP